MKYLNNLLLFIILLMLALSALSGCSKKLVSSKTDKDIQLIERKETVMIEGAELSESISIKSVNTSNDTTLYNRTDPTGRTQLIVKKEGGNLNITAKALPKEEEVAVQDKVITVTNESVYEKRENFFDEIKDVLFFGLVAFIGFFLIKFIIKK